MSTHRHTKFIIGASASFLSLAQSAEITWGTPAEITAAADISNPAGSSIIIAADFNTAAGTGVGDDDTINGILFVETPAAGSGNLVTNMANGPAYGDAFFPNTTDDGDLDGLLDAHAYTAANPAEVTVTINGLTLGKDYQVQLIGVADGRGCCAGRTYEPDDGQGNYTTGVEMARGGYATVLGDFTADANSQAILWRSLGGAGANSDAGFSGLVVLELVPVGDADGDGLFDAWETANGLNPNNEDSDGDLIRDDLEDEDLDGLNNLGEQEQSTDITKNDTDDDGYLDGVETNTGIWINALDTGSSPTKEDSDTDGLKDGVENPDLPYLDEGQTGSDPNKIDTDTDNLPDNVEVTLTLNPNNPDSDGNGTNDDSEDHDSDGSTNGDELTRNTDPADDDTDDDGFKDGAETGTGIWASASDTGTDPLNDDTDNDGIKDGVENHDLSYDAGNPTTQPGTDPNLADTDGDLRSDSFELAEGSDPTNPNSFTAQPEITFLFDLIGGDLTDPENDGIDTEDTAGENFNWVSIAASEREFFSDATAGGVNEGAFDVFDNKVGGGEAKWCCGGAPQDITVEFEEPVSLTHFTITSGNDSVDRDPIDWEIQGSDDGITFMPIFTHTGSAIWTERNQTALVTLSSSATPYKFIRYSVTATGGALHQIGELEYFGDIGAQGITITDVTFDEATDMVTLTWNSKPGRTYTVFTNTDLILFEEDVSDSVVSGGEFTTFSFTNTRPGALKQFFQVLEN